MHRAFSAPALYGTLFDDDLESVPTPQPVDTATVEDSDDDVFQATGTTGSQDAGDSDEDTRNPNTWDHASSVAPTWPSPFGTFGFPSDALRKERTDFEDGSNHANTRHPQCRSTHAVHDGCAKSRRVYMVLERVCLEFSGFM